MSTANLLLQNVQPKAGTVSVDQPHTSSGTEPAPTGGNPAASLLGLWPMLLFIPLIFMMFRRQKKETEARDKLKKGDKVVTNGGLIGELVEADKLVAKVRIAPGTTVQVLVATLAPFTGDTDKAAS